MDKYSELSDEEKALIVSALYEARFWDADEAIEMLIVKLDGLDNLKSAAEANGWLLSKKYRR